MIFGTHARIVIDSRSARYALLRKDECHDKSVQAKGLGKDQNENHADEQFFLLAHGTHTRVAHNADGHARSKAA